MDKGQPMLLSKEELEAFKSDYSCCNGGKYNLKAQIPHLKKLADAYLTRYESTGDWTVALKTHALFNSLGVRCPEEESWAKEAYKVQKKYWNGLENVSFERQQEVVATLKARLESLRSKLRIQLETAEKCAAQFAPDTDELKDDTDLLESFYSTVEQISTYCTNGMLALAKAILEESVNALCQPPPCSFCVVAIGSLAKGEATPYSDLEYLFLIENKDEETVQYFEKLAVTSYFLIGNLRETKLNYMALAELKGWFDDQQKNGFKIDGLAEGAGNIPTGNGSSRPENHFIVTPEELLRKYKEVLDNPVVEEAKRGDLTAMLQYTELIFSKGDMAASLLKNFTSEKTKFENNHLRNMANRNMFEADSKKYNFRPDQTLISKGYTVNSKRELYRYPSILLYNISILMKCNESSSWNTLKGLCDKGFISSALYRSLSFLLACACYFRLSAYLYHDSHDDRLSVLPTSLLPIRSDSATISQVPEAGRRWYLPQGLFNEQCEHSILVKDHIRKCPMSRIEEHLRMPLPELNWLLKFQVYYCCNRWADGLRFFHREISEADLEQNPEETLERMSQVVGGDLQELWNSVKALSYCLFQYRKWSVAFTYNTNMLGMIEPIKEREMRKHGPWTQGLMQADILHEIGTCYVNLQDMRKAIELFTRSLEIRQNELEPRHELIAMSHYAIGDCEKALRKFENAERHALQALQIAYSSSSSVIEYDYYGDPKPLTKTQDNVIDLTTKDPMERLQYLNHSSMMQVRVVWNLGRTYFNSKRYLYSANYFRKARNILQEVFGADAYHRELGSVSLNYAMACDTLGDFEEADVSFRRAMAIYTRVGTGKDEGLFEALNEADKNSVPGSYYELAINTFLSLPGFSISHPQTAAVLRFYSFHLVHMGQHQLAKKLLNQCLDIFEAEVRKGGKNHNKEATAYVKSVLALNCWKTKQPDLAEKLYAEALDLRTDSTEGVQLHAAEILQSMSTMYTVLEQYKTAEKHVSKALEIYQQFCKNENHPKIIDAKQQLQDVQSKYKKASHEEIVH